jgi:hypothetical protein
MPKFVTLTEELSAKLESFRKEHPEIGSDKDAFAAMLQANSHAPPSGFGESNPDPTQAQEAARPGILKQADPAPQRQRIRFSDGEEYIACALGAMETELEIPWNAAPILHDVRPAKCPWLTDNPNMSNLTLSRDYCKRSKTVEGASYDQCPILTQYQRKHGLTLVGSMKMQLVREKQAAVQGVKVRPALPDHGDRAREDRAPLHVRHEPDWSPDNRPAYYSKFSAHDLGAQK